LVKLLICAVVSAIFSTEVAVRYLNVRAGPSEFTGERQEMDTSSLDKQAKQHLKVYENVMFAAKICIVAIIATLIVMAATLV
tara:strand:- start:248 stop:493 length:246 start_codon:yes stop_codon:yes gene_type:complete